MGSMRAMGKMGVRAAAMLLLFSVTAFAEQRFPPPDFEGGHQLPITSTPAARAIAFQYLDVAVLVGALGLALWLIYRTRSRKGLTALSIFSVAYFGFCRKGCICAIGSVQNVALGLFDPHYALPLSAIAFFLAPLVVALFAGRAFCSAVCPHGAIQDLVLIKPVKVPAWLEHALGLIPYFFLGAGMIFAATGSAFVICRFDPFVPFFRFSGSTALLALGAAFLAVGMFVGRPYCRFLCPYGALLAMASSLSKWRVRVTPDTCTQCRLCEHSCPYGAMREPASDSANPRELGADRKRLGGLLLLLPVLIALGGFAGSKLGPAACRVDRTVHLAEHYAANQKAPIQNGVATPEALELQRAEKNPEELLAAALAIRHRFTLAGWLFGAWVGLVIGAKLILLSVRQNRTDFEPDRAACYACARCFESCPSELLRIGIELTRHPKAVEHHITTRRYREPDGVMCRAPASCSACGAPPLWEKTLISHRATNSTL